jgi:hypothetical protein
MSILTGIIIQTFLAGMPLELSEDWYRAAVAEASSAMFEEEVRTRKGFEASSTQQSQPTQPVYRGDFASCFSQSAPSQPHHAPAASVGLADPLQIWRMLPALKHLPEVMLNQLSRAEVLQLNDAFLKESKVAGKLQTNAKLTMNAQQLVDNPVMVAAGPDDRKAILHKARFLGGASCSNQALWLLAREEIGLNGVVPLGNYDLDSVGCGGCVTPKAWYILHNPSSSELKIKLFHMANVSSSALPTKRISLEDGDSLNIGENLRDIADMEALRAALNAAREAMASALPWNRSISALFGFFTNSNWCAADLSSNPKRAAILAEFCDYVFARNALNWENSQPFLSTDELAHTWAAWKAKRSAFFSAADSKKKQFQNQKKDDICRKFNTTSGCPNSAQDCKTYHGTKLRHVCNKFMPGGGKCEKPHSRPDHK